MVSLLLSATVRQLWPPIAFFFQSTPSSKLRLHILRIMLRYFQTTRIDA